MRGKITLIAAVAAVPVLILTAVLSVLSFDGVQKSIIVSALKNAKIESECETFEVSGFSDYHITGVKLTFEDGTTLSAETLDFRSGFFGIFFTGTLRLDENVPVTARRKDLSVPAVLKSLRLKFRFGFFNGLNAAFKTDEIAGTVFKIDNAVVNIAGEDIQLNVSAADRQGAHYLVDLQKIVRDKRAGTLDARGRLALVNVNLGNFSRERGDYVVPTLESASALFRLAADEAAGTAELKIAKIRAVIKNEFVRENKKARAVGGFLDAGSALAGTIAEKTRSRQIKKNMNALTTLHDYFRELKIEDGRAAVAFDKGGNGVTLRDLLLKNEIVELHGNGAADLRSRKYGFSGEAEVKGDLGEILQLFGKNPFPIELERAW